MPGEWRVRLRMEAKGLQEIKAWAITSTSSPRMTSGKSKGEGEGEGVHDSGSDMSVGGVPHGSRSGEQGDLGIYL